MLAVHTRNHLSELRNPSGLGEEVAVAEAGKDESEEAECVGGNNASNVWDSSEDGATHEDGESCEEIGKELGLHGEHAHERGASAGAVAAPEEKDGGSKTGTELHEHPPHCGEGVRRQE